MPIRSKAQRRYLWWRDPELAEKMESETPAGKKLPEYVSSKRKTMATKKKKKRASRKKKAVSPLQKKIRLKARAAARALAKKVAAFKKARNAYDREMKRTVKAQKRMAKKAKGR